MQHLLVSPARPSADRTPRWCWIKIYQPAAGSRRASAFITSRWRQARTAGRTGLTDGRTDGRTNGTGRTRACLAQSCCCCYCYRRAASSLQPLMVARSGGKQKRIILRHKMDHCDMGNYHLVKVRPDGRMDGRTDGAQRSLDIIYPRRQSLCRSPAHCSVQGSLPDNLIMRWNCKLLWPGNWTMLALCKDLISSSITR